MGVGEIQAVIDDWHAGHNHGQLLDRHDITKEQEFAIIHCAVYYSLAAEDLAIKLQNLSPAMKAAEIIEVMTA